MDEKLTSTLRNVQPHVRHGHTQTSYEEDGHMRAVNRVRCKQNARRGLRDLSTVPQREGAEERDNEEPPGDSGHTNKGGEGRWRTGHRGAE